MPKSERKAIGYILKRFPILSETFVLNEMLALEARGTELYVFSLERPNDPRYHDGLPLLKARIAYVPGYSEVSRLRGHNARLMKRDKRHYMNVLGHNVRGPHTLLRTLQAGYIANEARRLGLSHLHAHFAHDATRVAMIAGDFASIPFSFTGHAVDIFRHDVDRTLLKRKIEKAKAVVTVSDTNKSFLTDLSILNADKIVRIYNGIDLNRFRPNSHQPGKEFIILTVGRLVEKKGHDVLIRAVSILRDKRLPVRLQIVGKGMMRSELDQLIRKLKLQNTVDMLGPLTQSETLERLQEADIFALACIVAADGNRDGLPVSIVEALSCGVPVITTDVTGNREVIDNNFNGLLIARSDPVEFAKAIEKLVNDKTLRSRLAASARPSVIQKFDLTKSVAELDGLFQRPGP